MQPESSDSDAYSEEDFERRCVRANVDTNDDECFTCGKKGKLNCCQTCVRTFHQNCSKMVRNVNGEWQCPICYSVRPCQFCGVNAQSEDKILCTICRHPSHPRCLQEYHQASTESLSSTFLKGNSYVCKDCLYKYGIRNITHLTRIGNSHNLVTQQPVVGLVQINYKSPIHFAFFREREIRQAVGLFRQKLIRGTHRISNFKNNENFYSNFAIQKLLEMKIPKKYEKYKIRDIKDIIFNQQRLKKLKLGGSQNFSFLVKWKDVDYTYSTWEDEFIVIQLDPMYKHLENLIKFEQGLFPKHGSLKSLMLEKEIAWDQSISYADIVKMAKYHSIYTIHTLEFNALPKAIPFISYFLAHNSVIEGNRQISIILARGESIHSWRKVLMELGPLIEVVQFGGSEANINAIKVKELSSNSRPKLHVLVTSYEIFQREKKFFASKMSEVGFLILENHRMSIQISHHFRASNTILLTNQPSFSGSKSQFLMEVRNSFKDSFIFRSDTLWNSVEVFPPHDLTFNTLNPSCHPENIKYFKVYTIREEKRVAILRFILRFGLPINNFMELYALLRNFQPQIFVEAELSEEFKTTFNGYMKSLLILLSIHSEFYLSAMIKQYYFLDIDPTKLQTRLLCIQRLRMFLKQGRCFSLPVSQIKDVTGAIMGEFTTWKEEDDLILSKLTLEYGCDNWNAIFQCKNWSQYIENPHHGVLSYLAYLKVKCIMQFKASKADFNQFVENRMELIFSHL